MKGKRLESGMNGESRFMTNASEKDRMSMSAESNVSQRVSVTS